jgi:glycosyltransferase involved in cell wall biosynthesis
MKTARILYICYFGIREPLVQTQVLPYLRELIRKDVGDGASLNITASLLTFEPKRNESDLAEFESVRTSLKEQGIEWTWLPYHKRFSVVATGWDVFTGAMRIRKRVGQTEVLHARSHVPMLMAAIARGFSSRKPKIIFDIRGFMPEEYADAGIWKQGGLMFRMAKRVEAWLMQKADGYVVLTEKARRLIFGSKDQHGADRKIEVIPCCVDLKKRFHFDRATLRNEFRQKLGIDERKVIMHLGALGGLYLTDEIAALLKTAREADPSVFAMFLTQSDPALIDPLLEKYGFGPTDSLVTKVPPSEVAGYLCASDIGLSFVKSSYATQSRSPTKIPEYLACGVPVIANAGVGDVDDLIGQRKVGALVTEFSVEGYAAALRAIADLGDVSERCRETAERDFDLETVGGPRYRRLYKRVLDRMDS